MPRMPKVIHGNGRTMAGSLPYVIPLSVSLSNVLAASTLGDVSGRSTIGSPTRSYSVVLKAMDSVKRNR